MKIKKLNHRKTYIIIGSAIIVSVAAILGWYVIRSTNLKKNVTDTPSSINYGPPTSQDINESNQHKQDIVNSQQSSSTNTAQNTPAPNPKSNVTPVIIEASQNGNVVEVRGFIPQITESGGVCTYTFTGSSTFTKQQAAVPDATTTRCPTLGVASSTFTPGTWNVTITYSSPAHYGTSANKGFNVN